MPIASVEADNGDNRVTNQGQIVLVRSPVVRKALNMSLATERRVGRGHSLATMWVLLRSRNRADGAPDITSVSR